MSDRDEFLKRILSAFKIEAEEIIENMTSYLLELEKEVSEERRRELQELIYRQAHTLKGASRAVDILEIESICQDQESVFAILKSGEAHLTREGIDILHKSIETISKILESKIGGNDYVQYDLNGVIIKLQNLLISLKTAPPDNEQAAKIPFESEPGKGGPLEISSRVHSKQEPVISEYHESTDSETIRVTTGKLDKLLMELEELLSVKLSTLQMADQMRDMITHFRAWETRANDVYPSVAILRESLKQKSEKTERSPEEIALKKTLRFLYWGNALAIKTRDDLIKLLKFWEAESSDIGIQIDSLLNNVKKIMTVPFSEVLELFPKIVRDLSGENGKSVKLIIRGEAIEIDRRILEKLKNPLIHLLRNCLDHGIEKPSVRKRKNKPEMGVIRINIEHSESNRIRFTIEDDGEGIDLKKLKIAVLQQDAVTGDDLESSEKLIQYIFKSGISTSDMITDISGRGLGLAILKRSIDDLGGTIKVSAEKDKGTIFTIELPVSLVTFRGILVKAGDSEYVVPTTKIERILYLNRDEVKTIENKRVIYYNKELVPLANLNSILEKEIREESAEHYLVMLINDEGRQIAVRVDGLEGEQEILVKSFNRHLKRIRNIAGATILGSGKVVLILNPADLVQTVFGNMELLEGKQGWEQSEKIRRRILIVEDSITSRMLLKNILSNAGYEVETAFDGIDGYIKVKEGGFDLVMTDVDMPRMNGFDMTARIRSDKEVGSIPIIIVTSLNNSEDLRHGEEVGANGYIMKSSFAQNDLVEIIEKLLLERNNKK